MKLVYQTGNNNYTSLQFAGLLKGRPEIVFLTFAAKNYMAEGAFTLDSIANTAAWLLEQYPQQRLYAFHAPMGAGKTTFIHAICAHLGVQGNVSSPTFSIINEYGSSSGTVYHIDLYRLKDEQEAVRAGVEDCLYSGAWCLVEWPERAPALFPAGTVHVYLETLGAQTRQLRIEDK